MQMEKQKIIVLTSIIIIISTAGYSLVNVYTLENLELKGVDNLFRFFVMSTADNKIIICNPTFIPGNFNQFEVQIYFEKKLLGTYVINSASIMSNSSFEINGEYISDSMAQSQSLFMIFDHLFSGSDDTVRIDPRKMDVVTQFQTTIIGIPYQVTEQYTAQDFWNMLNDEQNTTC